MVESSPIDQDQLEGTNCIMNLEYSELIRRSGVYPGFIFLIERMRAGALILAF